MSETLWYIDPNGECLWYLIDWEIKERIGIWRLLTFINIWGTNGQEDG